MLKSVAEAIQRAVESETCEQAEIYDDYSGRCMYGDTTTGVVVPSSGVVISSIMKRPDLFDDIPNRDIDEIKTDSMGHDIILY